MDFRYKRWGRSACSAINWCLQLYKKHALRNPWGWHSRLHNNFLQPWQAGIPRQSRCLSVYPSVCLVSVRPLSVFLSVSPSSLSPCLSLCLFHLMNSSCQEGGKHKSWKKRYFVLTDNCLYYFVKESDSEPKGIVPLENLKVRARGKNHCFN